MIQNCSDYRNRSCSVRQKLFVAVCLGSSGVYLGDPPVPAGRQGIAGAAEIIIQQATGGCWDSNLGNEQHFIVAVALGKLRHLVALPVAWTGEVKRLATGFGRQLPVVTKKREQSGTPHSFINFCKHLLQRRSLLKLHSWDRKKSEKNPKS